MTARPDDPALRRRRHEARVGLLKRRIGLACVLGFATLFGLAAQHAVGAGSKRGRPLPTATPQAHTGAAASFFDASGDGYTFNDGAAGSSSTPASQPQAAPVPAPPVAQTSVS